MSNLVPKIQSKFDSLPEVEQIIALGRPKKFHKGDFFCRVAERPEHMFYLIGGLVKCSYLQDGKEVIMRLMCDNSLVLAYSAFITGKPSVEDIQCLSDCEGVVIPIDKVDALRKENPNIDFVYRFTAEKHYLSLERRLMMLHHKKAEERYAYFCEHMEAKIVEETPAHVVASYLGVTPESFSRVKRNLKP